jgi:hypothetical protein
VPLFTPWTTPVGWREAGATQESFALNVTTQLQQLYIEEQATPVITGVQTKEQSIAASLAEDTMENLALFMGGTTATVAGPPAVTTLTPSDSLVYWTFALEMRNKQGLARRFWWPKCIITACGALAWRRSQEKRLMPITITPQGKPSDTIIRDITALA